MKKTKQSEFKVFACGCLVSFFILFFVSRVTVRTTAPPNKVYNEKKVPNLTSQKNKDRAHEAYLEQQSAQAGIKCLERKAVEHILRSVTLGQQEEQRKRVSSHF